MKKYIFSTILIVFISTLRLVSQDTLWLMNGKKILVTGYQLIPAITNEAPVLEYINLKGRHHRIDADEAFKIDSAGTEIFYYHLNYNEPITESLDQVRSYVLGQITVRNKEKPRWIFGAGVAIGFGSAFIAPASISIQAFENLMYAPLIPGGYAILMNTLNPKEEKIKKQYPQYANDEFFINGYQDGLKRKRGRNAIIGAGIGLLAGLTFVAVTEY